MGESFISKVLAIETGGPPYNVHIKMKTDKEKKKLDVVVCPWKLSAGELETGRSIVLSGQPLGCLFGEF